MPGAGGTDVNPDDILYVIPRDAIPAILTPVWDPRPDWLRPEDRVVGIEVDGDARAYPLRILNWHEIVNDRFGSLPVAVTYCPLCGTGLAFDRNVDGQELTFGVSGRLYKNDLVMYDHQTETWWSQVLGRGIRGPLDHTALRPVTAVTLTWSAWAEMHPGSRVLARPVDESGRFLRNYDTDPYAGYSSSSAVLYPRENVDDQTTLHPKEFVLGIVVNGEATAYPYRFLQEDLVVNDVVGGMPVLVTFRDDVAKAWVRGNRTFAASESDAVDAMGNRYDRLTGAGPNGSLDEVPSVPGFWFAWFDFHPETSVYGADLLPRREAVTDGGGSLVLAGLAGFGVAVAALVAVARWRARRRTSGGPTDREDRVR